MREAWKRSSPELSADELGQVIKLVGRSPRVYQPGTLDALKQHRTSISLQPPGYSVGKIGPKETHA
jgi:hypothetical protein